jgi:CRISPR/Cas system-associated exonuclease Cas4 (RecB family)
MPALGNAGLSVRYALCAGTHAEVELLDRSMMWRGRADFVTVSPTGCSVVDLKTGQESEDHLMQMRVYALLWVGDKEVNPSRLPIESLSLSYGGRTIELPVPLEQESAELREVLCAQTKRIRAELEMDPVVARPTEENCRFCQVKLLCNDCWSWNRSKVEKGTSFEDLELVLLEPKNESSWIAKSKIEFAPTVLLKRPQLDDGLWSALGTGLHLRLTDAMITEREDGQEPLVAFTSSTEALLLRN